MRKTVLAFGLTSIMAVSAVGTNITPVQAKAPTPIQIKYLKNLKKRNKNYTAAPKITSAVYDHGYIFPKNIMNIKFTKNKYATSYDVVIGKDKKFKVSKTYRVKTNEFFHDPDKFITPSDHGTYTKVRANYLYGYKTKWSKVTPIGCGKLHLKTNSKNN